MNKVESSERRLNAIKDLLLEKNIMIRIGGNGDLFTFSKIKSEEIIDGVRLREWVKVLEIPI